MQVVGSWKMNIASMKEILCKKSSPFMSNTFSASSARMIVHAFKEMRALISTTPFTELTVEELNGKPTFIEELLLIFTSMNIPNVLKGMDSPLMSSDPSLTVHDIVQVISICVSRSLTESIHEYMHRIEVKEMLFQYIIETLLLNKAAAKEPLFADQLIFLQYICSLDLYIKAPEIAKTITIVICNDIEIELLDPTGNYIDLDFSETEGTPTCIWTPMNRIRLNTALSILHLMSKLSPGHQIAADVCFHC